MTTGNKTVEKAGTASTSAKPAPSQSSARDCMTSKARENNQTENQSCSFIFTIELRNRRWKKS